MVIIKSYLFFISGRNVYKSTSELQGSMTLHRPTLVRRTVVRLTFVRLRHLFVWDICSSETFVRLRHLFVRHLFVWDTSTWDLPGISGSGGTYLGTPFRSKPYITRFPYYLETHSFQTFGPSKRNVPHGPYSLKKVSSSSETGAILKNSLPFIWMLGVAKFLGCGLSLSW
jgi:hypothetical protein